MKTKTALFLFVLIIIIWKLSRCPEGFTDRASEIHEYLSTNGRPTYTDYHKAIGGDIVEYSNVIDVPNTRNSLAAALA